MTAYVKCRRCGKLIKLVINCMFEAPVLFSATCDKCGKTGLYSYVDVVEDPPCKISEKDTIFNVFIAFNTYLWYLPLIDQVNKYLRMINERLEHVKK